MRKARIFENSGFQSGLYYPIDGAASDDYFGSDYHRIVDWGEVRESWKRFCKNMAFGCDVASKIVMIGGPIAIGLLVAWNTIPFMFPSTG